MDNDYTVYRLHLDKENINVIRRYSLFSTMKPNRVIIRLNARHDCKLKTAGH